MPKYVPAMLNKKIFFDVKSSRLSASISSTSNPKSRFVTIKADNGNVDVSIEFPRTFVSACRTTTRVSGALVRTRGT